MKFKLILSLLFLGLSAISNQALTQGATCGLMEPICLDSLTTFEVTTGTEAEVGNDYGCMFTQPNPNWYYLKIETSGLIEMELFADSDIDFIVYGPFANLDSALTNCGNMGSLDAPIVDCSYSGVAYETPEIPSGITGEYYVLLVTNYAAVDQTVSISQISGEGSIDCTFDPGGGCETYSGTFKSYKNNEFTETDIFLCISDSIEIYSDTNYVLPADTIAAPIGDGIYTAQIIWLVYGAAPTVVDPASDPAYLDLIIPSENFVDANTDDSPIIETFGCGTYYLVPITADDGIGDGGDFDNEAVNWDLDSNSCYDFGETVKITYTCPEIIELPTDTICLGTGDFPLEADSGDGIFFGDFVDDDFFNTELANVGLHTVFYEYETDEGCVLLDSTVITVIACLGIAEFNADQMTIYPNPFENYTTLDFGQNLMGNYEISITNLINQEVYRLTDVSGSSVTLYCENLETGIYFVNLISDDNIKLTKKVVIVD